MSLDTTALLQEIKNLKPEEKKGLCKNVFGELKGKEMHDFAGQFFKELPATTLKDAVVGAAVNLPEKEKQEALKETAKQLPLDQQVKVAGEIQQGGSGLPAPGEKTRDRLWLVVVSAFAFVLMGTFISIATAMFIPIKGGVTPELVLTMFTSVVGFLAGLFVPSPAGNRQGDGR